MKRFLALFLTITMLLAMFAACTPKEEPQGQETTPESTTQGEEVVVTPTEKMAAEIVASLNPTVSFDASFDCKEAVFSNATSDAAIVNAFTAEGYTRIEAQMVDGAKFEAIYEIYKPLG